MVVENVVFLLCLGEIDPRGPAGEISSKGHGFREVPVELIGLRTQFLGTLLLSLDDPLGAQVGRAACLPGIIKRVEALAL